VIAFRLSIAKFSYSRSAGKHHVVGDQSTIPEIPQVQCGCDCFGTFVVEPTNIGYQSLLPFKVSEAMPGSERSLAINGTLALLDWFCCRFVHNQCCCHLIVMTAGSNGREQPGSEAYSHYIGFRFTETKTRYKFLNDIKWKRGSILDLFFCAWFRLWNLRQVNPMHFATTCSKDAGLVTLCHIAWKGIMGLVRRVWRRGLIRNRGIPS
jgi:hypothetical protein